MKDAYDAVDEPAELALVARPVDGAGDRCEVFLAIDGIHCAACSTAIEAALAPLAEQVEVNVVARRARLVWKPAHTALSELLRAIARLDYAPRPVPLDALDRIDVTARRAALWRLLVGLLCMMQVMMFALPRYVAGDAMTPDLRALMIWAEAMLAAPVLLFAAGPFFTGAWSDLKRRRIGMDTPVALGIAVTVATSLAGLGRGEDVYFDSVTMFVTLLLGARWLESAARARAAAGLAASLARLPETARRVAADGSVEAVSRRVVVPGDRLQVAAGETFAADGVVADGDTTVDESLLTGESRPIPRSVGDPVVAGSLNLAQPVEIVASRRVVDSRLAELQRLVERAAAAKPAVLRRADRIAGPFLGAVVVLAALTWAGWALVDPARAPWIAAAVLIVTCPCAIALAAPSALLAALGHLARNGVAVGTTDALETLAAADVAVFDKTGTLTTATPRITLASTHAIGEADAIAIAAAVEAPVLHPVARAFETMARDIRPTVAIAVGAVGLLPGGGVRAELMLDGRPCGATVTPTDDRLHLAITRTAPTTGPVAEADFRLEEALRADAAAAIERLRADGLSIHLASGDHPHRVAPVAATLGIPSIDAHALASPDDKLALVEAAQRAGHVVLMVGDGVNDAPVLERADVSASFVGATPLARHHADVLLLGDRLEPLVLARHVARRALRIVNQNLALSIAYNVVAIPLAVAGLLNPWQAGLGMAASSLAVCANALRAGQHDRAGGIVDAH